MKRVTEAEFERIADAVIMRRLATDRAYNHAENAEAQAEREAVVERRALVDLHALYEVTP